MPKVSVIVTNWNGKIHLKECFDSLFCQSYKDFEVIMVDNNSEDDSVEFVKSNYPKVRIIQEKINHGYCGGNNIGVEAAEGEYLFLLNNDTALKKDCIKFLVETLSTGNENVFGAFPKVKYYHNEKIINTMGTQWHQRVHWRDFRVGTFDLGQHEESFEVFGSIFPAVLLKRDLFLKIGSFDDKFFSSCEDFDLCYRTNLMGYKFLVEPKSEILHKYRATSSTLMKPHWNQYFFIRNYMLVFLKNYSLKNLIKYFPYAFRRYVLKGLTSAICSIDYKMVFIYLRVILFLIIKAPYWLSKRFEIQKQRKVPDELLWDRSNVEELNPFNYKGRYVYSLLNLRASKDENIKYNVEGKEYTIK